MKCDEVTRIIRSIAPKSPPEQIIDEKACIGDFLDPNDRIEVGNRQRRRRRSDDRLVCVCR
jgi:hypothetical protein